MRVAFPSPEFDDAVAAVCHGSSTEAEMRALNELLRNDQSARDEYLLRIALHTRLASQSELFTRAVDEAATCRLPGVRAAAPEIALPLTAAVRVRQPRLVQVLALAACVTVLAVGLWGIWHKVSAGGNGATSTAVAMLTRTVDAKWSPTAEQPRVGAPLEPGVLRLSSGLAQVVFYSGARLVLEGPAEVQLVSRMEAFCSFGQLLLEVPAPARGFRLKTPQLNVVDAGTAFGISAGGGRSEVHVFKGKVELGSKAAAMRPLGQGQAAVVNAEGQPRLMAARAETFASLFEFQQRSLASEAYRYEQWQFLSAQLNEDPSLLVRFDFETPGTTEWTLRNTAERNDSVQEATIVGCQRAEGRWREKLALEFQSVNDRVRLAVPGDFKALTISAWVCIKGLDRRFNSLFMSEGFDPGTVHWLIRSDGVLGMTVFGDGPGEFQILASPPVLSADSLGMWQHLAVVIDGKAGQVVHYLNGSAVSHHPLNLTPPFRIGTAELGNWNARGGPKRTPELVRNFSGSMDEFALFSRALSDADIRELYAEGKPYP